MKDKAKAQGSTSSSDRPMPPGKVRIMEALKSLLREKEFAAITWADIADRAEVNVALIYKYFKDTRQLLFQVLEESLRVYLDRIGVDLKGIEGAPNKLRKFIWSTIHFYSSDRVFAKILLLEVRSFPNFFSSEPYRLVKEYSRMLTEEIIEEGMKQGEIRDDVPARHLRDMLFGSIEHLVLPGIIFDREIDPDKLTRCACDILFDALGAKRD